VSGGGKAYGVVRVAEISGLSTVDFSFRPLVFSFHFLKFVLGQPKIKVVL